MAIEIKPYYTPPNIHDIQLLLDKLTMYREAKVKITNQTFKYLMEYPDLPYIDPNTLVLCDFTKTLILMALTDNWKEIKKIVLSYVNEKMASDTEPYKEALEELLDNITTTNENSNR